MVVELLCGRDLSGRVKRCTNVFHPFHGDLVALESNLSSAAEQMNSTKLLPAFCFVETGDIFEVVYSFS